MKRRKVLIRLLFRQALRLFRGIQSLVSSANGNYVYLGVQTIVLRLHVIMVTWIPSPPESRSYEKIAT